MKKFNKKLTKGLAAILASSVIAASCGGGGGSSNSSGNVIPPKPEITTLSKKDIGNYLDGKFSNVQRNIPVEIGFSPVKQETCDFYFKNDNSVEVCLDVNDNFTFEGHPKISIGKNKVGYFAKEGKFNSVDELSKKIDKIDLLKQKPSFSTNFPLKMTLKISDNGTKTRNGEICFNNPDLLDSVKMVLSDNSSFYMDKAQDGCYVVPWENFNDGSYKIESVSFKDIDNVVKKESSTDMNVGKIDFINSYNTPPTADLKLVGTYKKFNGEIRDINKKLEFSCVGNDKEDGQDVDVELKYKTNSDSKYTTIPVINGDNANIDISNMGGKTLEIICSVTDSGNLTTETKKEFKIEKNQAPVYIGGLSNVTGYVNNSIPLPSAEFVDPEGDPIVSNNLSVPNPFVSSVTGTFPYHAIAKDIFGAEAISPSFNIKVIWPSNGTI